MILRFNEGLQKGINVDELLDKTSKNYIGKGLIQIYKSDKDAITQIIAEKSAEVSGNNIEVPPYSEEKYGSVENYLNSQEYLDYKFPGRVKLRKDLLDTSDITQEEFDKGADQMIIDGNVLEISDYDGFPGIEYKGQFYAYDDEGNPPKRFLERLQKDRENNKVKAGKISLAPYKKFEKLIIDEEGLLLKAKKLFKEKNFTIGYGRNRSSIKEGDTITKEKALEYLKEDITIRLDEIQNRIPLFNQFSENLQLALFYEYYRGSVGQSTETIKLINAGKFKEAAEEFLRNDEYINAEELGKKGIRKSMEKVSNLLKQEKAGFI
jgi:GH24 family phage-related lysozyme (muramidase)